MNLAVRFMLYSDTYTDFLSQSGFNDTEEFKCEK